MFLATPSLIDHLYFSMSCPSTIDGVANDSAAFAEMESLTQLDLVLVERSARSSSTMVSLVKEVKPMEKALQLKKEKNQKNMISQGNFCAHCKPFSNETNGVFNQQDSLL